jgi:threonine synthase
MDALTASPSHPPFVCSLCGTPHTTDESEYTCLWCGPSGILEPAHLPDLDEQESPRDEVLEEERWHGSLPFTHSPGIWRYENLLALSLAAPRPPLLVGNTPLFHAQRLGRTLDLPHLSIKNDSLNPSGSLKDRASAIVLARAAQIGAERVASASTGNTDSSLAGLAASMGMPAAIVFQCLTTSAGARCLETIPASLSGLLSANDGPGGRRSSGRSILLVAQEPGDAPNER